MVREMGQIYLQYICNRILHYMTSFIFYWRLEDLFLFTDATFFDKKLNLLPKNIFVLKFGTKFFDTKIKINTF